ncbi:MAG: SixA phosphatase family protein [Candidatus Marisimplicoccus sp.]
MKVITFLRHSKSSWENNLEDIHRPLSKIGIEKIKKIAISSKDHFISSEIIFTSSANRALYTSVLLSRILSINLNKIRICDELYTFNYNKVFDFIETIDNNYSKVVLVGHNPAFTDISNYFSENKILNLPTARWFSLKFESDNWSDIINLKPVSYLNNLKIGI